MNDQACDNLHKLGLVNFSEQVRECDRLQPLPDLPGLLTEYDECEQDPEADIQHGKPDQSHTEVCGLSPETDNSRRADERGPVGQGDNYRVGLSPGDHVILGGLCLFITEPAEIEHDCNVNCGH